MEQPQSEQPHLWTCAQPGCGQEALRAYRDQNVSEKQLASITVDLKNGAGSITVTLTGPNWAEISPSDREWVFSMVDSLKDYANDGHL